MSRCVQASPSRWASGVRWFSSAFDPCQRRLIEAPVEIFFNRFMKYAVSFCDLREEGHRGAELHVIGLAENVTHGFFANRVDQRGAFLQPPAEQWVSEIGRRLIARGNGEYLSHRAIAEALGLRKHEPHPVRSLLPAAQ